MRYDDQIVDQVQNSNDIVEIISACVPLKKAGKSFKALCPFHQEKTPSFIVNAEKQTFHCFGCGAGGDVFSFLMKYENLTFPEALKSLAERAHVTLPVTTREREEDSVAGKLFEIYEAAFHYYRANFQNAQLSRMAREYLEKRGFPVDSLAEFGIGYAIQEWRGLLEHLTKKGFKQEIIVKSGLIVRSGQGNVYDLFRGRLMFPIHNVQGKVVAFGGRILTDELPKYINSPETEIFRKRREFYGFHLAKRFIPADERRLFIVEGYLDQIRLYVSGFKNTVATLGTALTEEHVRILKRYIDEAVLVYDGDKAGQSASLRGLEIFLQEGLLVKLLSLPQGKDPDDLIRDEGAEAFGSISSQTQDVFDFKLALLLKKYDHKDALGLLKITGEFLETFAHIANPVLLDRYINKLSLVLGVQEESIRKELAKLKKKAEEQKSGGAETKAQPLTQEPDEYTLLSVLLSDAVLIEKALEDLAPADFADPRAREIFISLKSVYESGEKISLSAVLNRLKDDNLKALLAKLSFLDLDETGRAKAVSDCVREIKRKGVKKHLADLQMKIRQAEAKGLEAQVLEYMKEYQVLIARIR